MKKLHIIFSVLALTAVLFTASAAFAAKGEDKSPDFPEKTTSQPAAAPAQPAPAAKPAKPLPAGVSSVDQALVMEDKAPVTLQGYIYESLTDQKYNFKDDSGTMIVKIKGDVMKGHKVSATQLVEISGKVHRVKESVEVNVEKITKK